MQVEASAALLLIYLPASEPEKAEQDGSSDRVPVAHVGDLGGVSGSGFSLAHL